MPGAEAPFCALAMGTHGGSALADREPQRSILRLTRHRPPAPRHHSTRGSGRSRSGRGAAALLRDDALLVNGRARRGHAGGYLHGQCTQRRGSRLPIMFDQYA